MSENEPHESETRMHARVWIISLLITGGLFLGAVAAVGVLIWWVCSDMNFN